MKQHIQQLYTSKEFFEQAQQFFNQEGYIQLQEFFNSQNSEVSEYFSSALELPLTLFTLDYAPLIHKKCILKKEKIPTSILPFVEYFKSKSFEEFVEQLTGFSVEFQSSEVSSFTHSCFELIHDSKITNSMLLDIYFFISKDEFEQEEGGHKVYTTYNEEVFYITPTHNALTCVFRDEELRTYTKYINSLAKNKQYIQIHTTFEIVGDGEEELM